MLCQTTKCLLQNLSLGVSVTTEHTHTWVGFSRRLLRYLTYYLGWLEPTWPLTLERPQVLTGATQDGAGLMDLREACALREGRRDTDTNPAWVPILPTVSHSVTMASLTSNPQRNHSYFLQCLHARLQYSPFDKGRYAFKQSPPRRPMHKEACTAFITTVVWAQQQKWEAHNYQPYSETDLSSPLHVT